MSDTAIGSEAIPPPPEPPEPDPLTLERLQALASTLGQLGSDLKETASTELAITRMASVRLMILALVGFATLTALIVAAGALLAAVLLDLNLSASVAVAGSVAFYVFCLAVIGWSARRYASLLGFPGTRAIIRNQSTDPSPESVAGRAS